MSLASLYEDTKRKQNDTPKKAGKRHSEATFANCQSSIQLGVNKDSLSVSESLTPKSKFGRKAGSPKQYCNISTITNTFSTITSTAGPSTDPNPNDSKKPAPLRGYYKAEFDAEQKRLKLEDNQKKKIEIANKWFKETSDILKQKSREESILSHNQPHYFDVKKKISPSRHRADVSDSSKAKSPQQTAAPKIETQSSPQIQPQRPSTSNSKPYDDIMKLARGHNPLPNNSVFSHTATILGSPNAGPYVYKVSNVKEDKDDTMAAPSGKNRHLLWKTKEVQTFKIG